MAKRKKSVRTRLAGIVCEECGKDVAVDICYGKKLCKSCLNPTPTVEYLALDWQYFCGARSMLGKAV